MRKIIAILSSAAILSTISCTKVDPAGIAGADVVFTASFEHTKAQISDDQNSILWNTGDSISVFDSESNLIYAAEKDGAETVFSQISGCIEDNAADIFAIHPYQAEASRGDNSIIATIPAHRTIGSPGLDASASIAIAHSTSVSSRTELVFHNLCSFLQLYIPESGNVRKVRLEGGNNEYIAGRVEIKVSHNGDPSFTVLQGSSTVELDSDGVMSGSYIVPLLPCTLQNGLKVIFTTASEEEKEYTIIARDDKGVVSAVTLVRNKINRSALDFEVLPPSLELEKVFWSDAMIKWNCSGTPASFDVFIDGTEIASLDADAREYHVTGLAPGSEHKVAVSSVYEGGRKSKSAEISFVTGAIRQLSKNLSPTSVSVEIENMVGAYSDNYHPCIYIELLDSENAETAVKKYSTYVLDAQIQSPSSPFFGGLVVDEKKSKIPLRIAMGSLEPGRDYWFRVKSAARYEFTSYNSSSATATYAESINGDSDFSTPVKLTTAAEHKMGSNEILFQGFDDFMIHPDYVNGAVGSVPAYKAAGKKNSDMNFSTIREWNGTFSFYGPRTAFGSSQIVHYGWASQQTASDDIFTIASGVISGEAPLPGAKVYNFKSECKSLNDWKISNNTYPCQGYIELGAYYNVSDSKAQTKGMIVSPALSSDILSSTASECTLSFSGLVLQGRSCTLGVWQYDAAAKTWTKKYDVEMFNSEGSSSPVSTWSCTGEKHKWYQHSLPMELKSGDRIALSSDGNGAALIDNISIIVKSI